MSPINPIIEELSIYYEERGLAMHKGEGSYNEDDESS